MGVLEQVNDLKNKGLAEEDIVNTLGEQGISPGDINDAINQSRIKSAVSPPERETEEMEPSIMRPGRAEPLPTEGSAPSDEELSPPPTLTRIPAAAQKRFGPMTKEMGRQEPPPKPQHQEEYAPEPQYQEEEYAPQPQYQEYYPEQGYGYDSGYEYPTAGVSDTDTMIEIAEQVFSEKIKTIQKQVEELNEFKTLMQTKVDNISDRLKRIEISIDRLQAAILEKVGYYGRGLEGVKKEMKMMQDSFGKVVGKLAHKPHHITHKKTTVVHRSRKTPVKKKTVSKAKKK